MATIIQHQLFSWKEVDASSDLDRLRILIEALPDEKLVRAIELNRGKGRNDYPVRAMFNTLLSGIVFQHSTIESLLRELRRNAELRSVCGFNVLLGDKAVPTSSAMSRFVASVIDHKTILEEVFGKLVAQLTELLPDFGTHLAFDGKAIPSHSTGRVNSKTEKTSDPDAAWGTKGSIRNDATWQKMTSWFGYQLHLVVDAKYELPVAFEVMLANASEVKRLRPMVNVLAGQHPTIIERCSDLSADRGLDCAGVNQHLWTEYGIKPVIDTRIMWKDEKDEQGRQDEQDITRSLKIKQVDNIVYTERGYVLCVCPVTLEERKMAPRGFEADRNVLGYRCPAAVYGYECKGREQCEQAALGRRTDNGRIVRVKLSTDWRIFTPIPRDSPKWDRLYAMRSSVERVNGRLDQDFGFEHHTIRGLAKMQTRVGLALIVMAALAVGFIKMDREDLMRSLVGKPRKLKAA